MNSRYFLVLPVLTGMLHGCGSGLLSNRVDEGVIEYALSFPDYDPNGIMSGMLPERTTISFDGDRQVAELSAGMGMFRTVIPAYIVADLLFALAFAFLFVKVRTALGGGVLAGIKLGLIVVVFSVVIGELYDYYGVTYMPGTLELTSVIFQVIAHAAEGSVAGAIYTRMVTSAVPARA